MVEGNSQQMGKWDSFAKHLFRLRPWQYVSWLMAGAVFLETLNVELKAQEVVADALLKVLINGQLALLHVECQSYVDTKMSRRMLEYSVGAEHQYNLPVWSFVIFLRRMKVPKPPYIRRFVDGRPSHHFFYTVIKLWEVPADALLDLDWDGFLPLLPFAKGGKKPIIVENMITRLAKSGDRDLLSLAFVYGGLAFKGPLEKARFRRRFAMFQDVMKDSWTYQEWMQEARELGLEEGFKEGREQGLQQGREQGLQQGREQGLQQGQEQEHRKALQSHRQAVTDIVSKRFPRLGMLAAQQVEKMTDLDALRLVVVNVSVTDLEEIVRQFLTDATQGQS